MTSEAGADAAAATTPAPTTARDAAAATAISIVGAVCGTVLTATFEGTPGQKLTGAIIGAIVATLFSVTGPYLHVRAAVGVLVTGAAVLVTYGGATVADGITGKTTFPKPPAVVNPSPTPSPSVTTSAEPTETCEDDLCISVRQETPLCSATGCRADFTVENTGRKELKLDDIEFDGPNADAYRRDDRCDNRPVEVGMECTFPVTVVAGPAGESTLVIHQNLQGPATRVPVRPSGADSRPDLRMSTRANCSVSAAGADRFIIRTALRNDGPGGFEGTARIRVTERDGQTREFITTIGELVLSMPTDLSQPGRTHTFSLVADPGDDVREADESDNTRQLTATFPERPERKTDVRCRLS